MVARLAEEVRLRVASSEISGRRLALIAGCSQPHMSAVLTGGRPLTLPVAVQLQRALGIDVREVLASLETGRRVVRWFDREV